MRDTLLQAIEDVKADKLDPAKAKSMAALAHQVNASLDVELRVLIAAKLTPRAAALVDQAQTTRTIASGVVEQEGGITRHTMAG